MQECREIKSWKCAKKKLQDFLTVTHMWRCWDSHGVNFVFDFDKLSIIARHKIIH